MTVSRVARILSWVIPIAALVTGAVMLHASPIVTWLPMATAEGTYEAHVATVSPIGLVLLGTGVLGCVATAIAESFRSSAFDQPATRV